MKETKIILSEKEMPTSWYNILPDLPKPLPPDTAPGHQGAHNPASPAVPQRVTRPGVQQGALHRNP